MKLAIIIPAYNEEKRIGNTLEEYAKYFRKKMKSEFRILVVINNTTDKTEEIVKEKMREFNEINCLNFKKRGKDLAIIEGFKEMLKKDFDLIGFVDADMATPPEAFYDLMDNIGDYDGAIASRWIKGAVIKTRQSFTRRLTSKVFNFITRTILFLPYRDTQCGAKLFKRQAIERVIGNLGITQWAFDVDLLYKLKREGFKIREIPTMWEDKKGSKLNLIKVPFQMFMAIMRLRLIYSPFSFIVRFYDKIIILFRKYK